MRRDHRERTAGRKAEADFTIRSAGSLRWKEVAATRSNPSAGSGHSSKDAVTTSAAGTFRRATTARFSLSSTAVTCHPRATIGAVACPMPHPISSTRGPGGTTRARSSYRLTGYDDLARS
jgi:hypothetical protein